MTLLTENLLQADMSGLDLDTSNERSKTYRVVESLNCAVNILRHMGKTEVADKIKLVIREINGLSAN